MVRSVLICTALIATTAFVAYAHDLAVETEERRDYRAQSVETGGHQGREYMQNGVLVIEGAPRWTEYRMSSTTRRVPGAIEPVLQLFD